MNALNRVFTTNRPGLLLLGTGCVLLGIGCITWPAKDTA